MTDIIVAFIGVIGTVLGIVLPPLLARRHAGPQAPQSPAPTLAGGLPTFPAWPTRLPAFPFPVLMILATTAAGSAGTAAHLCKADDPLAPVVFLLGVAGTAAALFGLGCQRESEPIGVYAGYCSAIFGVLLIVWWNIGGATGGTYSDQLTIANAGSCTAQRMHGILTVLGVLASSLFLIDRGRPVASFRGYVVRCIVAVLIGWATALAGANSPRVLQPVGAAVILGAIIMLVRARTVRQRFSIRVEAKDEQRSAE